MPLPHVTADAARAHFVAVRDGKSKLAVVQLGIMLVHCSPDLWSPDVCIYGQIGYMVNTLGVPNMDSYNIDRINGQSLIWCIFVRQNRVTYNRTAV